MERSIKIIRAVAGQERIRSAVHLTAWTPEAGRPYAGPPWVSPSPFQRAVSHSRLELSSWTGCRRRSARQSSVGGGGRGGSLSGSGPASFKGPRKGLPAMGMGKARLPPRPEAGNKRPGSVAIRSRRSLGTPGSASTAPRGGSDISLARENAPFAGSRENARLARR